MLRKLLVLFSVFIAALLCAIPIFADNQLTFATGGTAGIYYPLGGGMARIWNNHIQGINVSVQATGASVENIRLINKGQVDLAFVQNDINHYAYHGVEIFGEKLSNFKVIASLYPETIQLVVAADSNIKSIDDLRNKKVSVGAPGSGVEANARQIVETYGIDYQDFRPYFLSNAEAVDQFKNGHIDAFFNVAGFPTAPIQDVSTTHEIRLVGMDEYHTKKLIENYGFYAPISIPAGVYNGVNKDTTTVGVMATLVCRSGLSNDLVYQLTKVLFEETSGIEQNKANAIKLANAKKGISTPFHPGALKYYEQKKLK